MRTLAVAFVVLLAGCAAPVARPSDAASQDASVAPSHAMTSTPAPASASPERHASPGTEAPPRGVWPPIATQGLCSTSTSAFDPAAPGAPGANAGEPVLRGLVEVEGDPPWLELTWWVDAAGRPAAFHGDEPLTVTGGAGTRDQPWKALVDRPEPGTYYVGYTPQHDGPLANGSVHAIVQQRQGDYVCDAVEAGEAPTGFVVPDGVRCQQGHAFGQPSVDEGVSWLAAFGFEGFDSVELRAWSDPPGKLVLRTDARTDPETPRTDPGPTTAPPGSVVVPAGGNGTVTDPWRLRLRPEGHTTAKVGVERIPLNSSGAFWVAQAGGQSDGQEGLCGTWLDRLDERRTYQGYARRWGCDGAAISLASGGGESPPFQSGERVGAGNHGVTAGQAHFVVTWRAESPHGLRPYFEGPQGPMRIAGTGTGADPWRVHIEAPPEGDYHWGSVVEVATPRVAHESLATTQGLAGDLVCDDLMDDLMRATAG